MIVIKTTIVDEVNKVNIYELSVDIKSNKRECTINDLCLLLSSLYRYYNNLKNTDFKYTASPCLRWEKIDEISIIILDLEKYLNNYSYIDKEKIDKIMDSILRFQKDYKGLKSIRVNGLS